jgi:hypothetical protein
MADDQDSTDLQAGVAPMAGRSSHGGMVQADSDDDTSADPRAAAFQKVVAEVRSKPQIVPSDRSWFRRLIEAVKHMMGRD